MIRLLLCLLIAFSAGLSAAAQQKPYDVYEFDIPAGRYQFGAPEATRRLLNGQTVYGRVKLHECRVGEEFGAGFRFQFTLDHEEAGANFGFSCRPSIGKIIYSARSYGREMPAYDAFEQDFGVPQKWLTFSMQVDDGEFVTAFGDHVFREAVPKMWDAAHFYAYCSSGVVEFFDPYLGIS
ncbi:MAG: hypothetical protein AAGG45_02485 [Pseudomonadota bacterium]